MFSILLIFFPPKTQVHRIVNTIWFRLFHFHAGKWGKINYIYSIFNGIEDEKNGKKKANLYMELLLCQDPSSGLSRWSLFMVFIVYPNGTDILYEPSEAVAEASLVSYKRTYRFVRDYNNDASTNSEWRWWWIELACPYDISIELNWIQCYIESSSVCFIIASTNNLTTLRH